MLTRVPRAFDADHPAGELLRYKSFTVHRTLSESETFSARLPDVLAKHYAAMLPFVRWLNASLGLAAAQRR